MMASSGRAPHRRTGGHSLADVAKGAGVSVSLVSRVLRGDDRIRVREDTRRRVLAVADELGYVPHLLARNLRVSRAGALGLVVHDVSNPIYGEIIRGAQRVLNRAGSVLLLVDADSVADEQAMLQIAGGGRVDGLLWQMAGHAEFDERVKVASRYVPVVLVNSRSADGICGVYLDDEAAVRLAMDHLIGLGHERIGFIGGIAGSDVSERRRAAYRQALADAGIPAPAKAVTSAGWDPASGHRAATELSRVKPRVTALMVTNALVATGVISALDEVGLAVPRDVSVVAIHDLWFAERLSPPLTVVRLPLTRMGERAAEILVDDADERPTGDVAITEPAPELISRGSTAPPPTDTRTGGP